MIRDEIFLTNNHCVRLKQAVGVLCRFTIKESTIKGAMERYLLSLWKGKTCLRITRILKITDQVFHLRLYLGIDCFLSLVATDGKDGHGLKPNFFEVFMSYLKKSPKTILWVVVPGEICFMTSSQLHKSILCMAKGTNSCFKRCATAVPNSIDGMKSLRLKHFAVPHGSSTTRFQTLCYGYTELNS